MQLHWTGRNHDAAPILERAVRMAEEGPKRLRIAVDGPATVTAGMITETANVDIMNPDHVLCHLDKGAKLAMELTVDAGKGYVPASVHRTDDAPIGLIPIDAIFSPVRQVAYKVENARIGQITDYDRLLSNADNALYSAKNSGRNRVFMHNKGCMTPS